MTNDISSTRLELLVLSNFRCFQYLQLSFDPRLTIIVAPNGGGKTAVLDAIAIAWRLFVDTIQTKKSSIGFNHADILLKKSNSNGMEPILPTILTASGVASGVKINWFRDLESDRPKAKTSFTHATDLKKVAADLRRHYQEFIENKTAVCPTFPIIGYYGTGRLFGAHKLTKGKKQQGPSPTSRINGYDDCLSASSRYKFFLDWFERFSREAQQESSSGQISPHNPRQKLQAVIDAVNVALRPCGWRNLKWDFAANIIVAQHDAHGQLPVDFLSDGIRNMIGLIADIAHRCVRLNPQFESLAARKTPGIVLIDEVDMHLHPEWQQMVILSLQEAFPSIQFIVTTHSPQVLTTVRKENIRILSQDREGKWNAQMPQKSSLAQESTEALAYVMNTHPRPQVPLLNDIQEYEQMARAGQAGSPAAIAIKTRLDDAGFEFSEADKSLFEFLIKKKSHNTEGANG